MLSFRIILRCGVARQRIGCKRCLSEQRVTPESLAEAYNEKITTLNSTYIHVYTLCACTVVCTLECTLVCNTLYHVVLIVVMIDLLV